MAVSRISSGSGFRGMYEYCVADEKGAEIVAGNMLGTTARELAKETAVARQLRPDCLKPVWEDSISLADGERLSSDQWASAVRGHLARMGIDIDLHQWIAIRHTDKPHDHVHIVVNRIGLDGRIWNNGMDAYRAKKSMRALEREFGVRVCVDEGKYPNLKKNEMEQAKRSGEIPPKLIMAQRIDQALTDSDGTREDFTRLCEECGVKLTWNISPSTGRLSGFRADLIGYEGKMKSSLTGSQIGKHYGRKRFLERLQARREQVVAHGLDGRDEIEGARRPGGGVVRQDIVGLGDGATADHRTGGDGDGGANSESRGASSDLVGGGVAKTDADRVPISGDPTGDVRDFAAVGSGTARDDAACDGTGGDGDSSPYRESRPATGGIDRTVGDRPGDIDSGVSGGGPGDAGRGGAGPGDGRDTDGGSRTEGDKSVAEGGKDSGNIGQIRQGIDRGSDPAPESGDAGDEGRVGGSGRGPALGPDGVDRGSGIDDWRRVTDTVGDLAAGADRVAFSRGNGRARPLTPSSQVGAPQAEGEDATEEKRRSPHTPSSTFSR